MKSESQIRKELRAFLKDTFFIGSATLDLKDADSFAESGTVTSTGILEVIMFLEQHFGLTIDDHELLPENFDSVDKLVQFVSRKQRAVE
jgi:acyl carrier protein